MTLKILSHTQPEVKIILIIIKVLDQLASQLNQFNTNLTRLGDQLKPAMTTK